jgi:RHS repeat-associated protein
LIYGNLVKSVINNKSTYFLGKLYQKKVDSATTTVQKYYSSGSAQIAVRTISGASDTIQWMLSDHLGSTSTTANADGTWNSTIRYSAFGEIRASSGITNSNFRYTGQLRQAELGLYYYVARWYDPQTAHFTQADTVVPDAGDAASYDRYTYVRNNPVKYNDPSGHDVGCAGTDASNCRGINNIVNRNIGYNGSVYQLAATKPIYQYSWIIKQELGFNACGFVSTSDSIKQTLRTGAAGLKKGSVEGYSREFGIQPIELEKVVKDHNSKTAYASQNNSINNLFKELSKGTKVIVDITIDSENYKPIPKGGLAHFVRVVGIDLYSDTITIQNTLETKPKTLTVDIKTFLESWTDPENDAKKPAPNAEEVYNWALFIPEE